VGREGDPLGGCEVLPKDTEGWDQNRSKPFALGQCIDCNQESPPDKMLRLCSATRVFIHVLAVRQFIQFSSTWHGFSVKGKVLRSCRRELRANRAEQKALGAHTPRLCAAFCFSVPGHAGNMIILSPRSGAGSGALELVSPQSSIGLFMWEVTAHFAAALHAAGLNVSILLRVSRGHGTSSSQESYSPHTTDRRYLIQATGEHLAFLFCRLNKI